MIIVSKNQHTPSPLQGPGKSIKVFVIGNKIKGITERKEFGER
jgi:hypothetical protein